MIYKKQWRLGWLKLDTEIHRDNHQCFVNHLQEEFEDTKGVFRIHKSKDRQHNSQKKKDKQRSTKHTHKTKNLVTWTPLKSGGSRRVN